MNDVMRLIKNKLLLLSLLLGLVRFGLSEQNASDRSTQKKYVLLSLKDRCLCFYPSIPIPSPSRSVNFSTDTFLSVFDLYLNRSITAPSIVSAGNKSFQGSGKIESTSLEEDQNRS